MSVTPAPPPPPVDPNTVPTQPHSHLVDLAQRFGVWVADRPWLAGAVVAAVVAVNAGRSAVWAWRHRRLTRHAHQVLITPPPEVDPAGAAAWWANLHELLTSSWRRRVIYGTPHVAMEYRWAGRQLTIVVWVPGTVPTGPVAAAARAAWPGAACTVGDATAPMPVSARAEGGTLAPALPAWYPLHVDHETDPMRALIAAGGGLHATERACVQVLARPATGRQATKLRKGAAALRTGRPPSGHPLDPTVWLRGVLNLTTEIVTDLVSPARPTGRTGHMGLRPSAVDPLRDRDARQAIDKTVGPQWEAAIRYAVANTSNRDNLDPDVITRRLVTLAHGLASAFGVYTARNRLQRRRLRTPALVLAARRFSRGFFLSADELAAVAALPRDLAVAGLDRARAKAVPAPIAVPSGGRNMKVLGRAEIGGHAVALSVVDARQHIHLLGSTGSGKSTQMCHMVCDDIRARRGVVVIDPKGDLALDILDRLPLSMADRIVLIDPDQPELDEHDLSHLDAYTAAARLVVDSRQTAAFTMRTRPPLDPVGETTAIRQAITRAEPAEPTGIEKLARRPVETTSDSVAT